MPRRCFRRSRCSIPFPLVCGGVCALMKEAGVTMTPAGATWPHGADPEDKNLRIAPTFPPLEELAAAMEVLCICIKLASLEKLLSE